jgi:hypothetical protein
MQQDGSRLVGCLTLSLEEEYSVVVELLDFVWNTAAVKLGQSRARYAVGVGIDADWNSKLGTGGTSGGV